VCEALPSLTKIGTIKGKNLYRAVINCTGQNCEKRNWWSVRNMCLAHGKHMVTLSRLGLDEAELKPRTNELKVALKSGTFWVESVNSSRCLFLYYDAGKYRMATHKCTLVSQVLCMD